MIKKTARLRYIRNDAGPKNKITHPIMPAMIKPDRQAFLPKEGDWLFMITVCVINRAMVINPVCAH